MKCPNCGKELPSGSKFCSVCGERISESLPNRNKNRSYQNAVQSQESSGYVEKMKKGKKITRILVIFFVLLISVFGIKTLLFPSVNSILVGSKGPKESVLKQDLQNNIEASESLNIKDFEVIKSMSEDNTYTAQIDVTAEDKYAEYIYDVEVRYTKYDQGWIIDSSTIDLQSQRIVHCPSENELIDMINELHENQPTYEVKNIIETNIEEEGKISCKFEATYTYPHVVEKHMCTYLWDYVFSTKEWEYDTRANIEYDVPILTDVEGEWDSPETNSDWHNTIVISNIEEDTMYVYCTNQSFSMDEPVLVKFDSDTGTYFGKKSNGDSIQVGFNYDYFIYDNTAVYVKIKGTKNGVDYSSIP